MQGEHPKILITLSLPRNGSIKGLDVWHDPAGHNFIISKPPPEIIFLLWSLALLSACQHMKEGSDCIWSAARLCYPHQSRGKQIWSHANRPVANFLFCMDLTYTWMTEFECDKGKIILISGNWTCFVPTWTGSLIWIYLWSDHSWCELLYLFHTKQQVLYKLFIWCNKT